MREMNAYCLEHIRRRRTAPSQDLVSKLVAAEVDGQRLDDDEIIGFVGGLLLLAGHITTTALLTNVILCLDEFPDIAAALRADPSALPGAIEEVLRFRTPLGSEHAQDDARSPGRRAHRTGGQDLARLAGLGQPGRAAVHGAGHLRHPPRTQSAPESRPRIHFCLGAPLARLEVRIAVEKMLGRWSGIAVADGVEYHDARGIVGAKKLPLRLRWA